MTKMIIWYLLPAGADYNLLGVARILEMHGIILYPAKALFKPGTPGIERLGFLHACNFNFWFSLGRKHSHDSDYDSKYSSATGANQPWVKKTKTCKYHKSIAWRIPPVSSFYISSAVFSNEGCLLCSHFICRIKGDISVLIKQWNKVGSLCRW